MALHLNILSFALLGLAAVAYARRRTVVLGVAGVLFAPVTCAATLAVFWPFNPFVAVVLLALTLLPSACAAALYLIDVVFAPFGVEMTYVTFLCWILCPLLVLANFVGMLF